MKSLGRAMNVWCVCAVLAVAGVASPLLAGPLGTDPNAAFRQSVVLSAIAGGGTITLDSAAYAPGTVIGSGVPTSAAQWTYAYQIFDNGVTFDRVRLDTAIGGFATTMGLAPALGAPGGADPSQLHLLMPFGLPAADYFGVPISGSAFTTTVYYTSDQPPYPGLISLFNGGVQGANRMVFGAGVLYTPVPGPVSGVGMGGLAIAGMVIRRRGRSQS